MLAVPGLVWAQCSQSISVIAGSGAQTYTSSGSFAGYSQLYVLADATNTVVETSTDGTFSAANFATAGSSYTVHALNYNPTSAPDPMPTAGAAVSACGSSLPGCKNPDYETDYICINVIDCTPVCQGTDITASSSGAAAGYVQEYLLVDASGTIFAVDNVGGANFSTSALVLGTYSVHALNYNPADAPVPGAVTGMLLSDIGMTSGCFNADLATDFICFVVEAPMSAGADNSATVCSSDLTFDVNTLIDAAADAGTMTSTDAAFDAATGILDLSTAVSPVTVTYTTSGAGVCPADDAVYTINIDAAVTADAGADVATACVDPIALGATGTGTWSGMGAGMISDINDPMATFTPDATQENSTVVLTWTVAANGTCPSASDAVNVVVDACTATTLTAVSDAESTNSTTTGGVSITIDPLANDIIPAGVVPTVAIDVLPYAGTLELNADGTYTYTPGANFAGVDSFTYTITDPVSGATSSSIVYFTVTVPVSLISSFINADCEDVNLVWNVGVEANIVSYTIQRSTDGITFENVTTVAAVGSITSHSYSYVDHYRVFGNMYYRIVANDFNTTTAVLKVMNVESACENNVDFTNIYPNPVLDVLHYSITAYTNQDLVVEIIDVTGKIHTSEALTLQVGVNNFSTNVNELAQGIYFIGIRTDAGEMINFKKFVKSN